MSLPEPAFVIDLCLGFGCTSPNTATDTSKNAKSYISMLLCAAEVQTHKPLKITLTPSLLCHLFDNTVIDTSNNAKATLACCYVLQRFIHTNG